MNKFEEMDDTRLIMSALYKLLNKNYTYNVDPKELEKELYRRVNSKE